MNEIRITDIEEHTDEGQLIPSMPHNLFLESLPEIDLILEEKPQNPFSEAFLDWEPIPLASPQVISRPQLQTTTFEPGLYRPLGT